VPQPTMPPTCSSSTSGWNPTKMSLSFLVARMRKGSRRWHRARSTRLRLLPPRQRPQGKRVLSSYFKSAIWGSKSRETVSPPRVPISQATVRP
jgi:hypothetical protein